MVKSEEIERMTRDYLNQGKAITKIEESLENQSESLDDYSPVWGRSYEAYQHYKEHNNPVLWENGFDED